MSFLSAQANHTCTVLILAPIARPCGRTKLSLRGNIDRSVSVQWMMHPFFVV